MTPIRTLLALALLAVSTNAPAAIGCSSGTSTLYHLNFTPSAPDLEPALGLPGGAGQAAEVLTVITRAGVEAEERVKEVNLDLEDLAFDAPAYNASVRDYRDGVLTMDVCVPGDAASILSHVTYRDGSGSLVGFYSAAATPRESPSGPYMAAVADRAGTARLGRSFNEGGAEVMRDWIEADTGVRPPRSTAEALFSAAQAYVLGIAARSDALAHPVDASRGAREGSALLVTGSNSDWWASSAYNDITTLDGNSLLGPSGRLQDLEDRLGQTLVGHQPSGTQPIHVIEGRSELEVETGECIEDTFTVDTAFVHPSPLAGTIFVELDDEVVARAQGDALTAQLACRNLHNVKAYRTTPQGMRLPVTTADALDTLAVDVSLKYVNKWLPEGRFFLSNREARAMINGGQGTRSYVSDLTEELWNDPNVQSSFENVQEVEQWFKNRADGNRGNGEFCPDYDPLQWEDDNNGDPVLVSYGISGDSCNPVYFYPGPQAMQNIYDIIKGFRTNDDGFEVPNNGFLTSYVNANPRLYGGEPGGEPDMDYNPTWNTQDPN